MCRRLGDAGALVSPVLTRGAARFVGPLTFTALADEPARTALFNEDGTANSQAHPAAPGSTITFFATGAGSPVVPFAVIIEGYPVTGQQSSIGPAPGFPADVLTVHATVPPLGIQPPGQAMVELVENGVPSQAGVTIWISQSNSTASFQP